MRWSSAPDCRSGETPLQKWVGRGGPIAIHIPFRSKNSWFGTLFNTVGVITTIHCLRVLRQINVRQEIAGKLFGVKMNPCDARSNEILAPSEKSSRYENYCWFMCNCYEFLLKKGTSVNLVYKISIAKTRMLWSRPAGTIPVSCLKHVGIMKNIFVCVKGQTLSLNPIDNSKLVPPAVNYAIKPPTPQYRSL